MIAGGYLDNDSEPTNNVIYYYPLSDSYEEGLELPTALAQAAVLQVFGGYKLFGGVKTGGDASEKIRYLHFSNDGTPRNVPTEAAVMRLILH